MGYILTVLTSDMKLIGAVPLDIAINEYLFCSWSLLWQNLLFASFVFNLYMVDRVLAESIACNELHK